MTAFVIIEHSRTSPCDGACLYVYLFVLDALIKSIQSSDDLDKLNYRLLNLDDGAKIVLMPPFFRYSKVIVLSNRF